MVCFLEYFIGDLCGREAEAHLPVEVVVRYLILVGDGMADFRLDELGGRTPLEAANTPAMDALAREGQLGEFWPIPDDLPPGSDIGNLALFGYDPHATFTGRAPLEAASMGISLDATEVAFRCNLVTLEDGRMRSFTSDHISSEEAARIIPDLNAAVDTLPVKFHAGVSYRHLAIFQGGPMADTLAAVDCTPPHNITGQEYGSYLPKGPGADLLLEITERTRPVFADHPVTRERLEAGKLAPTSIWLWGQGRAPRIEPYPQRFGLHGAVVSAVDLVKGIGLCAGLESLSVPGATGYLDTNYAGKVAAALGALERSDFAYLHVEAPDETAHEGRVDLKIKAIEDFDAHIVAPCKAYAEKHGDVRIFVGPDHVTAIPTKTHAGGPVPFAVWGPGIPAGTGAGYSERAAADCGLQLRRGYEVVPALLTEAALDAAALRRRAG